jgi:hypothetical protein
VYYFPLQIMADGKGKGKRNGKGKNRGQSYLQQRADSEGHSALGWEWYCIDDVVMGGQSSSSVSGGPEILNFAGTVSTVGGGFASCKTKPAKPSTDEEAPSSSSAALEVLRDVQGITITVSGMPTHNFKFNVKVTPPDEIPTDIGFGGNVSEGMRQRWASKDDSQKRRSLENLNWRVLVPMPDNGEKHSIFLPFSSFFSTMTGQPVTGFTLDPTKIVYVSPHPPTTTHSRVFIFVFTFVCCLSFAQWIWAECFHL